MQITVTYNNGRTEVFNTNSLTSVQPFGPHTMLNEFDMRLNDLGEQSLFMEIHHYEDIGEPDSTANTAELIRQRGRRCALADHEEIQKILSIEADGKLLSWQQGGTFVNATLFEYACMLYYSGPAAASNSYKAIWLFDYLSFAYPEKASSRADIAHMFGYPLAAYDDAERAEHAQPNDEED